VGGLHGLQLGATATTFLFAVIIVAVVVYLTITRTDQIPPAARPEPDVVLATDELLADDAV
jgi:hypothetical protein